MNLDPNDPKLTAYVLGELDEAERAAIEAQLQQSETARRAIEEIRHTATLLSAELAKEPTVGIPAQQRQAIETRVEQRRRRGPAIAGLVTFGVAASILLVIGALMLPAIQTSRESAFIGFKGRQMKFADEHVATLGYMEGSTSSGWPGDRRVATGVQGVGTGGGTRRPDSLVGVARTPLPAHGMNVIGSYDGKASTMLWGEKVRGMHVSGLRNHDLSGSVLYAGSFSAEEAAFQQGHFNTEAYDRVVDNPFLAVAQNPLSTFSIDVDTASYANVRRFLGQGQLPPKDAVRIEELVNYFSYDYPLPDETAPFSAHIEVAACPWQPEHRLVRIGLKGREISQDQRPPSNLVFLLDVSGSMEPENKLPLLKRAMRLLVEKLTENDRVAIAVYAGASGLVLPSTTCENKETILAALEELQAGGSTNGGSGIQLAYDIAVTNFIKGGTNRVVLCTDGDFNVGITNQGDLIRLVEERAKSGVFLSVLGFGMGNYKDSTLEKLADKGNGNYAYIDTLQEARKVLVEEMGSTLIAIAKDVKIQMEFNPAQVSAYRLIGYENRLLRAEDFNDDTKDAGEIGAGHTVTALYEIVPAGKEVRVPGVDPLKYQTPAAPTKAATSSELLTLKLRYKDPEASTSKLLEFPATDSGKRLSEASADFQFAAAVAMFGMLLRDSPYKGDATFDAVLEIAGAAKGPDEAGYRSEFMELVRQAKSLVR